MRRMILQRALQGVVLSAVLLSASAPAASAQTAAWQPRVAVTQHVAKILGREVPYTATVGETLVRDAAGKPAAAVVTIAYTRSDVKDLARRPVIFLFNGGPGASSSPLHMSALGPVIREKSKFGGGQDEVLHDNTVSALDAADLVFIDPVSTGFSRALPGADPKPFYDTKGDAIEVAAVITDWLKTHHREASPRFLAGESYGTTRAPLILNYAPQLKFDGVLLISGGGSRTGDNAREINGLATMAAAAWYHQKIDRKGRTVGEVADEANAFATTDYAAALAQGDALPAAERHKVAERMSALIGLPVELIESKGLRIDQNTFMFNLLKDQNLRIGKLDTRTTAPLQAGADGAFDDPALGVAKPGPNGAPPPTPASVGAVPSPAVGRYIVEQLKFPSTDPYYGVNFLANSQWVFQKEDRSADIMARAMKADPHLRLFSAMGLYDLGASDGPGFEQAGVPMDRLTLLRQPGPHEVYDGDNNRAAFNAAVRKFVTH
jgi:carboxypeptidase C (cathepsin A)